MLQIHNLTESINYCEAAGLAKCFEAYAENCAGEHIMGIGFNPNSGHVYIALENGVEICSMLGNKVEYLHTDENGLETFFDEYKQASTF